MSALFFFWFWSANVGVSAALLVTATRLGNPTAVALFGVALLLAVVFAQSEYREASR